MMTEFTDTSHDIRYKTLSDLSVWNIGFEDCVPGWEYGPTIRPYHIIHFVRRGEGKLFIGGITEEVHGGQAFLIPADSVSRYKASETDPWSYAWIGFMGGRAERYFHKLMAAGEKGYVLSLPDAERYAALIEKGAKLTEVSEANSLHVNSLLLEILAGLEEDTGASALRSARFSVIDEVKLYLDVKYTEPLRMDEVARRFGLHPNYMTRAFREKFALTPKKYMDGKRMEKACQLLENTDMPVGLIAEAVGVHDPLAFSKCFHSRYGVSPSQYRKKG